MTAAAEISRREPYHHVLPLTLFGISAIVLLLTALFVFQILRDDRRASVEANLKAVAELKLEQLENWLEEQQADISFLSEGSHFAIQFDRWLAVGGNNAAALAVIQARIKVLGQTYGYDTFGLFDTDGKLRISNPGANPEHLAAHQALALAAMRQNQPLLIDFHQHPGEPIRIGMIAPLKRLDARGEQTIGALLLAAPAAAKLFPLLQHWPLPSKTGEIVLARREGNEILYIVTYKAAPMTVHMPTSNPDLPIARVERGEQGILRGARDYVGDPVLAYGVRVPGTPWMLVAKQDQSEVDAPLEQSALWLTGVMLLLLSGVGAVTWFWWRSQENRYRTKILEQKLAQAVLTEQAAAELEASEEKYRVLADYSADWEYWVGADHTFRYVSPACEAICGYAPADFYADPQLLERIIQPDDLPRWHGHVGESHDSAHPSHALFNLRIQTRQGEERWIEHICTSVFDAKGAYLGQRGSNRDITDRIRAETAVQESESRFKLLIDEAPIPMCFVTRDGALQFINQRFIETFGYNHEDVPTLNEWWQLAYPEPEYRAWVLATWSTAVADAQARGVDIKPIEYRVTTKQGETRDIEISGVTIGDDLLATFHDVTERRQLEQQRAQYREQLEAEVKQRTAELSQRTTALEIANHDLENFSYSVSHDLRAPLRAIDGFVGILLEDYAPRLDAEGLRLFGVVQDNARKMGHLIDDILAFSRAGRLELDPIPVDMNALVQEVWSNLTENNNGRAIELKLDGLPAAQCDPRAIRQVWQNLLANAIKFTRDRHPAVIQVSAMDAGEFIRYAVADNGVGFNANYAGKLFVLFQRLHGMDEFEGTGVGLAIVKRFIQKHGGQVEGVGVLDQGATFNFTLSKQHDIAAH
jgi:PAS domain S-box-containing protein